MMTSAERAMLSPAASNFGKRDSPEMAATMAKKDRAPAVLAFALGEATAMRWVMAAVMLVRLYAFPGWLGLRGAGDVEVKMKRQPQQQNREEAGSSVAQSRFATLLRSE